VAADIGKLHQRKKRRSKLVSIVMLAPAPPAMRPVYGQQSTSDRAAKRPEFDVVSSKPTKPTGGGAMPIGSGNPGSVTLQGVTARK